MQYILLIGLFLLAGCTNNHYSETEAPYVYDSFKNMYIPNPRYMTWSLNPVNTEDVMYKLGYADGQKKLKPRFSDSRKYMIGYIKGISFLKNRKP